MGINELVQGLRQEMTTTLTRVEGKVDLSLSQLGMIPSIAADVERHQHAIYGNGEEGMKTRVSVLEKSLLAEIVEREKTDAARGKMQWALVAALLGLLGERLKQLIFP